MKKIFAKITAITIVSSLSAFTGVSTVFAQTANTDKENTGDPFAFILEKFPLWITAIVVFGLSVVLGLVVKNIVENRIATKIDDEHQEIRIISGRVAFMTVLVIGITIALAIAGINLTSVIAAIGFGISFGLQDTISNFVAGMAVLASRSFTIGDWIKVNGKTGKVVEIRTRATILKTFDGLRLIVPNSQLYKGAVLSYTSNPVRRLKLPVYARYGAPMKDIVAICKNVLKENNKVLLEPKPTVVATSLEDSYMVFQVRFWVDSKSAWRRIQSDAFVEIQKRLEQAGLDAPYAVTSLSFEPEIESYVVNNRQLDDNSFKKMIDDRIAEEDQYSSKRKKFTEKHIAASTNFGTVDESGSLFLRATTPSQTAQPLQTAQPQVQPMQEQPVQAIQTTPDQIMQPAAQPPVMPQNIQNNGASGQPPATSQPGAPTAS